MPHHDSITRPIKRPIADNAPMFVSLYVVLLAFFIVLNSMSREDLRRRIYVLDSVRQAFDLDVRIDAPSMRTDLGVEMDITNLYSRLRETVSEVLAIIDLKFVQTGETLQIEVPERKLFRPQTAILLSEGLPLMQRLAAQLQSVADTTMDLRILAPHHAPTETWHGERLAKLTGLLTDHGIAPERISIGYAQVPGGMIRFEFLPTPASEVAQP